MLAPAELDRDPYTNGYCEEQGNGDSDDEMDDGNNGKTTSINWKIKLSELESAVSAQDGRRRRSVSGVYC